LWICCTDSDEGEDDDEEEEDEADADPYQLPITHEAALAGTDRAVLTLDVEHSGNRVVTGSMDNIVRMYDFNGMKSDLRPFR
jgi:WD40 repeat protein